MNQPIDYLETVDGENGEECPICQASIEKIVEIVDEKPIESEPGYYWLLMLCRCGSRYKIKAKLKSGKPGSEDN